MANEKKIRVGITQGDTNGIGYEVILKALADPMVLELFTPVVYGSSKVAAFHRKACGLQPVQFNSINNAIQARDGVCNMVELNLDDLKVELGVASEAAGRAAFTSLECAVADLRNGAIDVLVTAPIDKNNIQSDTFHFPGHTEYLESSIGDGASSLMVLFNDRMRVALVTTHLPVSQIASAITKEKIISKIEVLNQSLKQDFAIEYPRIAVLALNPHSGDHGLLGNEEKEIITPAIEEAYNEKKICCFGPYAADGFFGNGSYTKFDGVLAMYHDQGLAPFKTLDMDSGVNFTAGLPFVRTSPDHGTGYDIAGKGVASPASMLAAIYAAIDIYRNRTTYAEIHANPLRKQYFDKSNDNVVLDLSKDDDDDEATTAVVNV
ncbi:MAG TPA: 4-hydroxythreonine-4-phosphate dehydrogenase PdxA [Candidatus Avimuribaculum pullicola]|nr:4-hydroxythreonine-4-phosphate dehydrogenase PdxA [Candidatus Avimuribaculum pullicola]